MDIMKNNAIDMQRESTNSTSERRFRISLNQIDRLMAKISCALDAGSEPKRAGNIRVTYEPLAVYLARNGIKYG